MFIRAALDCIDPRRSSDDRPGKTWSVTWNYYVKLGINNK